MAPKVNITGRELLRARRHKDVSVDKYADAREILRFDIQRALVVGASNPAVTIEDISACLAIDISPEAVVNLIKTNRNLGYIVDLVGHAHATVDEAVEAYDANVPAHGSYGYISLRMGRHKIDHQTMVDACTTALRVRVSRELFMAYTLIVGLDEPKAAEVAKTLLDPAYYVAAIGHEYTHQQIVDRCDTAFHMQQFQQEVTAQSHMLGYDQIAEIRHELGRFT